MSFIPSPNLNIGIQIVAGLFQNTPFLLSLPLCEIILEKSRKDRIFYELSLLTLVPVNKNVAATGMVTSGILMWRHTYQFGILRVF